MSKPVVLVVDDNDVIRKIAAMSLRRLGLEVDQAATGEAAVEACRERFYDLILMDVSMPGMSGLDATILIRRMQHEQGCWSPIVAVTAGDARSHCIAAGMDDHIVKPADYARIVRMWIPQFRHADGHRNAS